MAETYEEVDPAADPNEPIVSVATFNTPIEADLAQTEIEMAGIESMVANSLSQTMITMPETGFVVEVRQSDVERATEILSGEADANENAEQVTDDFVPDTLTQSDDAEAGG